MQGGGKRCTSCGRTHEGPLRGDGAATGVCQSCGAPLEGDALSEFANRLARFGLGATRRPLLTRLPELPDAK